MVKKSRSFVNVMKELDDKQYMFNLITYNISPTIAGVKPSSLITFSKNNKNMYELWKKYRNEYVMNISLDMFEIKDNSEIIVVLFYNKKNLVKTLFKLEHVKFLNHLGYNKFMTLEECLYLLKERYDELLCPHEIGIFLGIPVKDVIEFINCSGQNCKLCGYWKVYHNVDEAVRTFNEYNNHKKKVVDYISQGHDPFEVIKLIS